MADAEVNGQINSSAIAGEPQADGKGGEMANDPAAELHDHKQERFKEFAEACRAQDLLERPASLSAEDALDGLSDETTLWRFLSARSFGVREAVEQFKQAHTIRSSAGTTEAYDSIDIDDFEQLRLIYPHWSGQRTKDGLPICTLDVANLDGANLAKYSTYSSSQITCRAITSLDYLTRFVLPLCSSMTDRPDADKPVSKAVYLADTTTLTLRQTWNIRGWVQSITGLLATCYPEVVDKIYVLNAPSYFSRIWALIKSFVDPTTAKKLVIVPQSNTLATLLEVMDIESIPERYGGKSKAKNAMVPQVANLEALLGVVELPPGPIRWMTTAEGTRTAVAVGTKGGEKRRELLTPVAVAEPARE